eukprot:TRINITY_DN1655_c0_g1_i1.p1 TRINITY_DN1655_c0_g1~~TRINITY_DN1655_c0_g1_i1.p1  ORF type:complete len:545 (-),score=164.11 TRINITY_DN1655_c0_g1_i1:102-1736(-)
MARFLPLAALLLVAGLLPMWVRGDNGGGSTCAACTLVFQLSFNLAEVHDESVDSVLENWCTILPTKLADECIEFIAKYGEKIAHVVANGGVADDICHALGVCTDATCRLFPKKNAAAGPFKRIEATIKSSPWDWLKQLLEQLINTWTDKHEPVKDLDGDFFSTMKTLRGSDWRGKDCNDLSDKVYPGRLNTSLPALYDHNCNGISGSNGKFQSYEKLYCEGTQQRGIAILGDSATAHFRLPPNWFNASAITKSTYNDILFVLENEADWPHRSWGTGHLNDTTGDCEGPLQSIYLQMLERNRCMFRDYQNIGVNGARTSSMKPPGIINSLARDPTHDNPLLVIYALIGNDVCHPAHSLDAMTTPEEFEQNVIAATDYLDTVLPSGSHLVFAGLVDGRVLWDVMNDRTHPIGCTYADLYDYLNCLEVSPCWGWMNSNATVRNATSARAAELNKVYTKVIQEKQYKNFDMAYHNTPLYGAIAAWEEMGGQAYELIEPVDGFHPSQIANALFAEILFKEILQDQPDFIGPVNPNNANIISMFGDQGGY